jgi:PTS system N-acetylgalactosamine-specific IIA component
VKLGYILTGHGEFAPGVKSALEMIAGPQENFEVVAFQESEPLETLKSNLEQAVSELRNQNCEGIVIFADLMGGTPFRTAMEFTVDDPSVEVIAGVSLTLLIEAVGARFTDSDLESAIANALEAGHQGMLNAKLPAKKTSADPSPGSGI